MERVIAQINTDEHKLRAVIATFERIINSAYDQKLAPGALSSDVLQQILIKNYMLKINRLSPRSASFTYSYKKKPYKAVSKKR